MMNMMKFNWRSLPVQAQAVLLVGAISVVFLIMQMMGVRGEKRQFSGMVQDGIRRAKRQAKLLWFGGQGPDFPAALHFPEGRYLKVGIYEMD